MAQNTTQSPTLAISIPPCLQVLCHRQLYEDTRCVQTRIGVGSRGQIFKAVGSNGRIVAVKVMNIDDDETRTEIAALTKVQPHPHIIGMLGSVEYSADSAFLVLEFAETDLLELIMASNGLPEPKCARYFNHLVRAVKHCHRRKVFHGDLKPENALVFKGDVLKLCDFGSAAFSQRTGKAAGSIFYAAPEVLPLLNQHDATPMAPGAHAVSAMALGLEGGLGLGEGSPRVERRGPRTYDAAAADVWSLGVILYVMLSGRPPFSEASLYDAEFVKLANGSFAYPPEFSAAVVKLLQGILVINPRHRMTIREVAKQPWVAAASDPVDAQHGSSLDMDGMDGMDGKPRRHMRKRRHHRRKHPGEHRAPHHHVHLGSYHSKASEQASSPQRQRRPSKEGVDNARLHRNQDDNMSSSDDSGRSSPGSGSIGSSDDSSSDRSSITQRNGQNIGVAQDSCSSSDPSGPLSQILSHTSQHSSRHSSPYSSPQFEDVHNSDSASVTSSVSSGLPSLKISVAKREPTVGSFGLGLGLSNSILHGGDDMGDISFAGSGDEHMESQGPPSSSVSLPSSTPFGLSIRAQRPPSTVDEDILPPLHAESGFGALPLPALRITSSRPSSASSARSDVLPIEATLQALSINAEQAPPRLGLGGGPSLSISSASSTPKAEDVMNGFQIPTQSAAILAFQVRQRRILSQSSRSISEDTPPATTSEGLPFANDEVFTASSSPPQSPSLSIRVPGGLVAAQSSRTGTPLLPAAFSDSSGIFANAMGVQAAATAEVPAAVPATSTPRLERSPPLMMSAAMMRSPEGVQPPKLPAAIPKSTLNRIGGSFETGEGGRRGVRPAVGLQSPRFAPSAGLPEEKAVSGAGVPQGAAAPGGPTYQLFNRVGTAMRHAVESSQAARGICEGFQLDHVKLLPQRILHKRVVPKMQSDDDASSYYSADDASSIFTDEEDEEEHWPRHAPASRHLSLQQPIDGDYESDDGSSQASEYSESSASDSEVMSEYYYTDGDDSNSVASSRSSRSGKKSLFGGLSSGGSFLGRGAANLLAASSILHNDAFDDGGFGDAQFEDMMYQQQPEAAFSSDSVGDADSPAHAALDVQPPLHHRAGQFGAGYTPPRPLSAGPIHAVAAFAELTPSYGELPPGVAAHMDRSALDMHASGQYPTHPSPASSISTRLSNLSMSDAASLRSGVKRVRSARPSVDHSREPPNESEVRVADARAVSSTEPAIEDDSFVEEDDDDGDGLEPSPIAVRPRLRRQPEGAATPLPSPLPVGILSMLSASSDESSAPADHGALPPLKINLGSGPRG